MIHVAQENGIAQIWLDRPETRNAFKAADWRVLGDAAEALATDNAVAAAILRSASPGTFCSGSDLGEIGTLHADIEARGAFRSEMRRAIDGIACLPVPVIAAIDGACFGAGAALALACDIRIASSASRFGVPPARLGISYPVKDVRRLRDAVGRGQSARLLFTAAPLDAAEGFRIGLVDLLSEDPADDALAMAATIASNESVAVRALKRAIAHDPGGDDAGFDDEFDAMFGGAAFGRRLSMPKG